MAKFQSPLLGYNNNVRHRGRVFHIQTEDSGVNHPHVITHLFMDGGRILKSVKKSYAEHVGSDNMSETVRVLMKEQHKAMFIALRDGQFDELVEGKKKPAEAAAPPATAAAATTGAATSTAATPTATAPAQPAVEAAPPTAAAPTNANAAPARPASAPPPTQVPASAPPEVVRNDKPVVPLVKVSAEAIPVPSNVRLADSRPSPSTKSEENAPVTIDEGRRALASHGPLSADPPLPPEVEALLRDELPPPQSTTEDAGPKTTREPERRRSAQELTLDFDALERDTSVSPLFQQGDLPPPPKNLFAKEPRTGTYSAVEADTDPDASRVPPSRPGGLAGRPSPQPAAARKEGTSTPRAPAQKPASEGRYAPARPAAIFGAAAKQASPSIFSDDLVSDKSLDEVILSYLAEDLDPPRRK